MINMKDLIKKQGDMIRKESGMNITEATSKPEIGDYFQDGRVLFGPIIDIGNMFGQKLIQVKPETANQNYKAVVSIGYDIKKIKDSGKKTKGAVPDYKYGKTIWVPK